MTERPHVVIIGPGAMGCLHAARLAQGSVPVTLLDHRVERAQRISTQGVQVLLPDETEQTIFVPCTADASSLPPANLVIILTKAHDTAAAIKGALPLVTADTSVLTLQNGLGNYEILQEYVPPAQVLAGTTSSGAMLLDVGRIRVAGLGQAVIGSPAGDGQRAEAVAALFRQAGLVAEVTDDVDTALWRKAIINAAINPLGALTHQRNGELLEIESLRSLLWQVAQETHRIALACGIRLADLDAVAAVEEVCRDTAQNQCSMLQDVLAGRPTEVRQINGEIVRRAKQTGTPATLNQTLTALVEGFAARQEKLTAHNGPGTADGSIDQDVALLTAACHQLRPAQGMYLEDDFIRNLFLTVVDFQMRGTTVGRALEYYGTHRWDEVRTFADLKELLARHPDDKEGNTHIAQYLWNYRLWTRVGLLRGLVVYFESIGVTDQQALRTWAENSDFKRDFEGKVKGLGAAAYQWLIMRQGVETVKPDVHLHRFVASVLSREVSDWELVHLLERVSTELGVKAYELDWRIWEYQRGGPWEYQRGGPGTR